MRRHGVGLGVVVLWGVTACGGRAILDGPGGTGGVGGSGSTGGAPYYAAGAPSYAGYAASTNTGGSGYMAGAPNYGGAPSYGGMTSPGGAPSYGGMTSPGGAATYGGSMSVGGAASAGAASTDPWEVQQLKWLQNGIVGTWMGTATFSGSMPCTTVITFTSDNHYSAHSPGDTCIVFYYGTNDDTPEKRYRIDDWKASGEGSGTIEIYFAPGDTNEGVIQAMSLSADEATLTFRVFKDGYGPIEFKLSRPIPL